MTVWDLIKELEKQPLDNEVMLCHLDCCLNCNSIEAGIGYDDVRGIEHSTMPAANAAHLGNVVVIVS